MKPLRSSTGGQQRGPPDLALPVRRVDEHNAVGEMVVRHQDVV